MADREVIAILSNHRGGIAKHVALVEEVLTLEKHDLEQQGSLIAKVATVRRILARRRPRRVVTHGVAAAIALRLRGRRYRDVVHIEMWHGDPFFRMTGARRVFDVLGRVGRGPDLQVFVHASLLPEYADPRSRHLVLPNAIPDRGGAVLEPRESRALFVGRYSHEKGLPDLLEAWRSADLDSTWALETYGEGPSTPSATSPGVKVHGFTANPQDEMAAADVVIIPSHIECSPYVALEAMEAGCVTVVTATGDMPELVERSGCGLVVPPGDVDALARALAEVARLDAGDRRIRGAAGREYLRKQRPFELWAEKVQALYGGLMT